MASTVKRRELIIRLSKENPAWSQKTIANKAKVSRITVSRVLQKFERVLNVTRKIGSGRKRGFVCPEKAKKVVALLEKNPALSNRKLAPKAGCSEYLVRKIKADAGLKSYKVQSVPDRNATKNLEAQSRAKKLKADFFSKFDCCIMDDETYVLSKFSQLPGQEYYTAKERGQVEEKFRTKQRSKFPKKFLVWQAICSCGLRSQSFITNGTINGEIYVKDCLQKRLLPFIRKHSKSTFFWPDLATCHYGKASLQWYKDNNIKIVPKEANPPNCPELRPIKRYWALVKKKLKESKKEAKDVEDFRKKWNAVTKKVSEDTIKALMAGLPEKLADFYKQK